ncbi:hypothetical protein STEG23_002007 [Scotinomys teguina]
MHHRSPPHPHPRTPPDARIECCVFKGEAALSVRDKMSARSPEARGEHRDVRVVSELPEGSVCTARCSSQLVHSRLLWTSEQRKSANTNVCTFGPFQLVHYRADATLLWLWWGRVYCVDTAEGMRSEEPLETMEDSWRPGDTTGQDGPCPGLAPAAPGHLGTPYTEAWGYFHLSPARPGPPTTGTWATCRLCGEQVGGHPGFQAWTRALWRHLSAAHLRELEKSGAQSSPPAAPCPPPPGPAAAAAEGDWARLLEQMGELAVRCSRREQELERREAALRQAERALERRRRALRQEERAMAQARRQLQAERQALSDWLREQNSGAAVPAPPSPPPLLLKKDPDGDVQGDVITKVLL